ncbi:site-specific integrase [Streptomyces sp. H34-S4]|uniref:site-specific integrase n=1 Tax=Streptomyces sp. H34-S4 TaxID=2996463 RepID=UPI00226E7934|nr:site-specific integrase [Streptomyces sp. H34-S4]MCY0933335.1 site-specific integrase [Streptomyces sp. H34-S4]
MPAVVQLPAGKMLTVRAAADVFLDSLGNPNTVRNYGIGVGKTAERLGEGRPLTSVADDEIGEALELLWGSAAVNTWNARRASVLSWLGWCGERGYDGPAVPVWAKRLTPPDSETPARSKMAIDRLIARREVHLREKTLWRMLYETTARAEEVLGVNIEELDLAGRRAPVKAKGARPRTRRRGAVRADFVLETVYWDAGTARLLPRLLKGRTRGPVFVTHRKPGPGKVVSPRDVCPDTGLARLSYGQARMLLDEHTTLGGEPGTGWDLHEWRHSGLTHLGEGGASLLMLMAKSRHKKAENVRKYFHPSAEAIAEVTSLLAPGDRRR